MTGVRTKRSYKNAFCLDNTLAPLLSVTTIVHPSSFSVARWGRRLRIFSISNTQHSLSCLVALPVNSLLWPFLLGETVTRFVSISPSKSEVSMSLYSQNLYGQPSYGAPSYSSPAPAPGGYYYSQPPAQPAPPNYHVDPATFRRDFMSRLSELTFNSRHIIQHLSLMAQEYARFSDIVGQCLEQHIRRVSHVLYRTYLMVSCENK
jgi:hypothetical protein